MATRRQCLRYIVNTGGNATVDNFKEDWEPVGTLCWDDLEAAHLAEVNADGKVVLTTAGKEALEKYDGQA